MELKNIIAGSGKVNVDLIYGGLTRLPDEGEEIYSDSFGVYLGGGTPATLINLSGLNIPVALATYLGKDIFSSFAKRELKKYGIKTYNLYRGKGAPLNVTSALLTPKDRTFVSYGEEVEYGGDIEEKLYAALKGAKYVIMERGYTGLYRRLKKDGAILVFDTGWYDDMSLTTYREYLELADYFLPNRKEALKVTGKDTVEEAAKVLASFFPEVIIKLDAEGAMYYKDGSGVLINSVKEFLHKDSTGAGDAFFAGFLYGIYHGYPTADAVLFGNITGGKCVTEKGCLTARLNEKELLEFYDRYKNQ